MKKYLLQKSVRKIKWYEKDKIVPGYTFEEGLRQIA